ncbi:MAG: DUF302 domain-containing protein [Pseudomonadota bacterium]
MRRFATLIATIFCASTAAAEIVRTEANGSVDEVTERLEAAVTNAGATVFAKVPHSKGAASIDLELNDATLLIFGNPKLGTPAMQQDIHAGLILPLRVLVYADDAGKTWIAHEDVETMFEGFSIDTNSKFVGAMTGALGKFSTAASGQ